MAISGNTSQIKKSVLMKIEDLDNIVIPRHLIVSSELAESLAALSEQIKREIALYIDRQGRIKEIMIGDLSTVPLISDHPRRNLHRLSGLRCIHTHPGGSSELSNLDMIALKEYRLDAMVAIGIRDGIITGLNAAFLDSTNHEGVLLYGPLGIEDLDTFPFQEILMLIDKEITAPSTTRVAEEAEKALLIGNKVQKGYPTTGEESLKELEELARTAGATVAGKLLINSGKPDPGLYFGKGKIRELSLLRQQESLNLVIIDDELSPKQQNRLEESIGCRVIDRTALILQIFADRARTKEGQLQVELAQLNYYLPRLTGFGISLSRLGGGIGTRGPGESKLETDRRHIRRRIGELNKEIGAIRKQRDILRNQRSQNEIPVVALVGYTNAGKSTLMNTLTGAGVFSEDKLFATLDPTVRRLQLKQGEVLLIDTVGFIRKLPPQLIAAFRATLEEINYADLLLHVVDISNPSYESQIQAVQEVLDKLGSKEKKTIVLFNKWDLVSDPVEFNLLLEQYGTALPISAKEGSNIEKLLDTISENLSNIPQRGTYLLPFSQLSLLNSLYEKGEVVETEYLEEGILCTVYLNNYWTNQLKQYQYKE